MISIGYMYKSVANNPSWLKNDFVKKIYSVSNCISDDFADWVNYWQHNGFWFFDSPEIIQNIANENGLDLSNLKLFFYKVYELQWEEHDSVWRPFLPTDSFTTNVISPRESVVEGYDVTTFTAQTCAECSPLSCNHMAEEIKVNSNCLLNTFEEAKKLLESGMFNDCEPGPYRIIEVHSVIN